MLGRGRQPGRSILPHDITLWNFTGRTGEYQKTHIKYVAAGFRAQENMGEKGLSDSGSVSLFIFASSLPRGEENGLIRRYLEPEKFLALAPERQRRYFTLNPSGDYFSKGYVFGDDFCGGDSDDSRRDYRIISVKTCYNGRSEPHHWEVKGQ